MKASYDELSPFTGELEVMKENNPDGTWNKMCFGSGYVTFSTYREESDTIDQYEEKIPELIVSHKKVDAEGYVWYPAYIPTHKAILFPIGDQKQFQWAVAEVKAVPEDKLQETKGRKNFLDVENASLYEQKLFSDAFTRLMELSQVNQDD